MEIVSLVIIKLTLIVLLGYYLYKRCFIKEEALRFLTFFVINFTVPFLIFSRLVRNPQIVLANSLWIFMAISMGIFFVGYLLGFISSFRKSQSLRREFISLVSFQNGGYLPMNIAFFLFPSGWREQFLVYIFLYLLGFNILIWSVGSFLIFRKKGERFRFGSILRPPIVSTILALLFIYSNSYRLIPKLMLEPLEMIGDLSFVLSLIVLGCWLAKIRLSGLGQHLLLISEVSFLKLIVVPFLFIAGLVYFRIFSLLGLFISLEAIMPSAVSLPIIANMRKADSEFVSQGVFFTHLAGIITIPLWLWVLQSLGFMSFQP